MSEYTYWLCVDCNENEEIDGFRCLDCKVKHEHSEESEEIVLEWIN